MNTIIMTGCPWSHVTSLFDHLNIQSATSCDDGGNSISIQDWHDQIFTQKIKNQHQQIQLGKCWEQFAGDLFRANWQQNIWGWADSRSTWLLDFWRDFDPNIGFILVHINPQLAIANAIVEFADQENQFSIDKAIATWLAYETELLRFHLRNPGRCLFLDYEHIATSPTTLIKAVNDNWALDLKLSDSGEHFQGIDNPNLALAELLAQEALKNYPEAKSLCQEIISSLSLLPDNKSAAEQNIEPSIADAITDFRALTFNNTITLPSITAANDELAICVLQCESEIEQLNQDNNSQRQYSDRLHQENERISTKLNHVHAELEQALAKMLTQEEELSVIAAQLSEERDQTQHHQTLITRLEQERDTQAQTNSHTRQENELLLLQLHQVQEELEQYFLKAQALDGELQQERNQAEQYQAQINQWNHERNEHIQATAQARQENELLLLQLHQLQEELEQYFLKSQTLENELQVISANLSNERSLNEDYRSQLERYQHELAHEHGSIAEYRQQVAQLTQEFQAMAALAEERQAQINQLHDERNSQATASSNMLRQENELLLLQLHQVQEELEHYFLQHQQEQKQREQANQRLARLYQRWPNFVDMTGLRISRTGPKNLPEIVITATDVFHSSRTIDEYSLRVSLNDKIPTLIIERNAASTSGALLRWPAGMIDDTAIVIPAQAISGMAGSSVLTTSDWQLLQALTNTCDQALQVGAFQLDDAIGDFNAKFWQPMLAELSQAIQSESNCLRYDSVKLMRKKVNPDYEYLWLQLGNLSFNGKHWPQAEFRFSAAAIKRKDFSTHPKLEFSQPQAGEQPLFENWQPDAQDEYGEKMEFRFETASQAIDISCWNGLSAADKALLLALIWQLPVLLADLESQKVAINRPWEDWQKLAQGIMATIKARVLELGII